MKPGWRYLIVGVLLLAVGAPLWAVGRLERRLVDARKRLLTLHYEARADEYQRIESAAALVHVVPMAGGMTADLREQRATSAYWKGDYGSLQAEGDAEGAGTEQDPELLLLTANAAYRRIKTDEPPRQASEKLEALLGQYADVLKKDPGRFDAAFNYQFVAKVRSGLTSRTSPRGDKTAAAALKPSGQTIHGRPGSEPSGMQMNEFKVIVPKQSDERREQQEAGKGGRHQRKG